MVVGAGKGQEGLGPLQPLHQGRRGHQHHRAGGQSGSIGAGGNQRTPGGDGLEAMAQQLLVDLTIHRHQGWNRGIIRTATALQHGPGVALHLTDDITAAAGAAAQ